LNGWNPIEFLDLDGVEAIVAREVLQVAEDMRHERTKALVEAIGVTVGNAVAKHLSRMFR
jgi:hypothetical protein